MSFTESSITSPYGVTGRSAFGNLLKTVYGPLWQIHYYTKVVIWALRNQPKGQMGGKVTLSSVITRPPQSSGISLFEYDNLPSPDTLAAINPEMSVRDVYSRIQLTGNVMRAAEGGNANAWAAPLAKQLETSRTSMQLQLSRKAYLGIQDILGKVKTAYNTGTNKAIMYGRNDRTSAAADWFKFGVHYLRQGQRVWHAASASTFAAAGQPAFGDEGSVYIDQAPDDSDVDNPFIHTGADFSSLAGASDPGADSYIIPLGSRRLTAAFNSAAATLEAGFASFNGLCNLLDDGSKVSSVYALDRTSSDNATLNGRRSTNSGTPTAFDELRVDYAVDTVHDKGTGTEPDVLVTDRSTRREVVKSMRSNRLMPPVVSEQGYTRLAHQSGDARLPYVVDRDSPPGMFWVLDSSKGGWLSQSNLGPLDTGDRRWVANKDAQDILMHMSGNAYDEAPYASGTIEDVAYMTSGLTA